MPMTGKNPSEQCRNVFVPADFRKTAQTSCFNIWRKWRDFARFNGSSADND